MNSPTYAIIAALDVEVELLKNALQNCAEATLAGTPAYCGTIGSNRVIVMRCGMGKVSAAIGTQVLIDAYKPDFVINTGCAGGIGKGLKIGDVILSESVVEWDIDLTPIGLPLGYVDALKTVTINADRALAEKLARAITDTPVKFGLIASADVFIASDTQREHILSNFPSALCAEMEGAAVGHTCCQNGVPFCVVRSLSDTADGDSSVDFAEFSAVAGKKSAGYIINMLTAE